MSAPQIGPDQRIQRLQGELAAQEAHVRRMILRGAPTQAAEDRLRQLQHALAQLRGRKPSSGPER